MIALSGRGRKAVFIRQSRHEEDGGKMVEGEWEESGEMAEGEGEETK